MECSICHEKKSLLGSDYTHCSSNHGVCKDCYLRMLKICFCRKTYGEIMYTCPICRHEHYFTNKAMFPMLNKLNGSPVLFVTPHAVCQNNFGIPNLIRKCEFKDCGCRHQSKEIEVDPNLMIAFSELIKRM